MHRRFALASFLPLLDPTLAWTYRRHHTLPQMPLCEEPDGGGGGNGNGGKGGKKKLSALLEEDEDLQEEIDAIVERRIARERRRLQGKGGNGAGMTDEEREELERLRKAQADSERSEAEKKGEYEKALAKERESWTAKEKKFKSTSERLAQELQKDRVRSKLISEAARAGAIDPEEIADLLERRVKFDVDELTISVLKDGSDDEQLNADGEPMTIEQLVSGYLGKKKHLVKAAEGEPAGAKGGKSGDSAGQKNSKEPAEIAALRKAFEDAKAIAEKSGSAGHMTKMQQAKRRYDDAVKSTEKK